MADQQHLLERRSALLASGLGRRVKVTTTSLVPPGGRRPYTTKMSKPEALRWWDQNLDTAQGQAEFGSYNPLEQMSLKQELERYRAGGGQNGVS